MERNSLKPSNLFPPLESCLRKKIQARSSTWIIFMTPRSVTPSLATRLVIFDEKKHMSSLELHVLSTWKAFGGNTCDLGSFGEETDKITTLHQEPRRIVHSEPGDGVTSIKRRRQDIHGVDVRDLAMASRRSRLKVDLESSTWRQR
ncbi:hypothetical protein Tco_0823640 [Tanacetum coccineum]|uniref:Uncharacterized protein n=1 Tax=Tanacetum coccineum TaxID=301880 RepID=A0ABQ5AJG0_9ASTR